METLSDLIETKNKITIFISLKNLEIETLVERLTGHC